MNQVEIFELNSDKAKEWYANEEGLTVEEVEDYPFFKNLEEVFEWVYLDENDSHQDVIDTCKWISNIDIQKVVEAGANSIAEYLALEWERLRATPYGYLAVEV